MTLKNKLLQIVTLPSKIAFENACKDVERAFEKKWKQTQSLLLQTNSFWTNKGFSKTSSIEEFPITDYSFYSEAMIEGAQTGISPFNNEKVDFCMVSSGTTGPLKPFLMTKSYKKQYQVIAAPFIHYMTKIMNYGEGKLIYLISLDSSEDKTITVPTGTIGNYTYKKVPFFLKQLYALPQSVLSDKETFIKEAPLYAIANDIAALYCVTPPVGINFLSNLLDNRIHSRIKQVLDDTKKYGVSKKRAKYLLSLNDKKTITAKDLWPTLQMTSTWTSSVCSLSLPKLKELTGNVSTADGLYSATEGWVCVQTDTKREGSIWHPDGCILEFIEVGKDIQKDNLIKPWQLEVGKQYEIFFTNFMGLIRYRIGDILECKDYFYQSPVLQFVQKTSSTLSLGIMRLTEEELTKVSTDLLTKRRFFFSMSQTGQALGIYVLKNDSSGLEESIIADYIDSQLRSLNKEYDKKRNDEVLKVPVVYFIDDHSFFPEDQTGQVKPKIIQANVRLS